MKVTFDARTSIEADFDFFHIYNGDGTLVGTYTETELAGKTIEVPGDTVRIQIISDSSGNEWGFKVTSVVTVGANITEPIKSAQLSQDGTTVFFSVNKKANKFATLLVGIFDLETGKMLGIRKLTYDGAAETLEMQLPSDLPSDFAIKTYFADTGFIPVYEHDEFTKDGMSFS